MLLHKIDFPGSHLLHAQDRAPYGHQECSLPLPVTCSFAANNLAKTVSLGSGDGPRAMDFVEVGGMDSYAGAVAVQGMVPSRCLT